MENILLSDLTADAKVRLADFGSAFKLSSSHDTTDFRVGTPGYIAPEVIKGQHYSYSCDLWSIGCLLHVLLAAVPPFWDNDRRLREHKVCYEQLDLGCFNYTSQLSVSCKELLGLLL